MAFVDTPRTDAEANLTFLNGRANAINDMSMEASFVEPKNHQHNLVEQMRKKRNLSGVVRTPSARSALNELSSRKPAATARRSGEFTPLLQSVTKRNASKALGATKTPVAGKENYRPNDAMPQFLKDGLAKNITPLSRPEFSFISQVSSVGPSEKSILRPPDSSGYSTPMNFPGRGEGALGNGRNIMNLKEQERIVDKIEKENFGLKLKIHFLEQRLAERDPNYNTTAVKENGQLKLETVMLKKDLAKNKKLLARAEKQLESLLRDASDAQANAEREEAIQRLEDENNELQNAIDQNETERRHLETKLEKAEDELDDLRAAADSRDDTADFGAKIEAATEAQRIRIEELSNEVADLKDEHDAKDDKIADLQAELDATSCTPVERIDKMTEEVAKLEKIIKDKDDELAVRDDEIASKNKDLASKARELAFQEDELESKDKKLTMKDNELASKDKEIALRASEITTKSHELATLRDDIRHLEALGDKDPSNSRGKLEELLDAKDAELADVRTSLNGLLASKDQDLVAVRGSYESSFDSQKTKLGESVRQISSLEDACASKDDEIRELKAKLKLRSSPRGQMPDPKRLELEISLKDSNEENEDLRDRWNKTKEFIDQATAREEELCEKIRLMRQDRNEANDKTSATQQELLSLRERYEEKVDELRRRLTEREREETRDKTHAQARDNARHEAREQVREEVQKTKATQQELKSLQKRHGAKIEELRIEQKAREREQVRKAEAAQEELFSLQQRYDDKVEEFRAKQSTWEGERARVRFVNTSMTSDEHNERLEQLEQKHLERHQILKLKYKDDSRTMAQEIRWLRAKTEREEGFKAALAHEKTFLVAQVRSYQDYNKKDLRLLERMNSRYRGEIVSGKRPADKLAAALHAVRFIVRVRRLASQWAEQKAQRPIRSTTTSAGKIPKPSVKPTASMRKRSHPALSGSKKTSGSMR